MFIIFTPQIYAQLLRIIETFLKFNQTFLICDPQSDAVNWVKFESARIYFAPLESSLD